MHACLSLDGNTICDSSATYHLLCSLSAVWLTICRFGGSSQKCAFAQKQHWLHCATRSATSQTAAMQVAVELTNKDVIRAHARDELGIDIDELANPLQVRMLPCNDCKEGWVCRQRVNAAARVQAAHGLACLLGVPTPCCQAGQQQVVLRC